MYGNPRQSLFRRLATFAVPLIVLSIVSSLPERTRAQEPDTQEREATAAIGAGDVLEIRVFGDASTNALSGRYVVDAEGSISFPLLGHIRVAGQMPDEAAKTIAGGLETGVSVLAVVTVSVAEFAPVFVVGDVDRPGAIPYRPGMTIMELVLLAGGIPQPDQNALDTATQRVAEHELADFLLSVQIARLHSEVDGSDLDLRRLPAAGSAEQKKILDSQLSVFAARRESNASTLRSYEAQRTRAVQEVSSLSRSIEIQDEEVSSTEEEIQTQANLTERGLSTQTRVNEIRKDLARARLQALEFRTELFRAEQALLLAEQNIRELDVNADKQNLEEIARLEAERAKNASQLDLARRLLSSLRATGTVSQRVLGRRAVYTLFRRSGTAYQDGTTAGELTELHRADIVRVDIEGDAGVGEASGEGSVAQGADPG
jgi:polysaccharide export outer membrane protein